MKEEEAVDIGGGQNVCLPITLVIPCLGSDVELAWTFGVVNVAEHISVAAGGLGLSVGVILLDDVGGLPNIDATSSSMVMEFVGTSSCCKDVLVLSLLSASDKALTLVKMLFKIL